MGVLNCTPDSFYAESRRQTVKQAVAAGVKMVEEGADFLDVGGESSRPGAAPVPADIELDRVIPVINELAKAVKTPISIDTYKAVVAQKAVEAGACIINDISALTFDDTMVNIAAEFDIPIILMHMQGKPRDMQTNPKYENVVTEISEFFTERIGFAVQNGIKKENIILDPGIGFGKRLEDNYQILAQLKQFKNLSCPILVGTSRKSFLNKVLGLSPSETLEGTIAANTIAILNGANILRVHDVKEAKRAAEITDYFIHTAQRV